MMPRIEEYKYERKQANVALANLSDAFQRSLSEPVSVVCRLKHYYNSW